MELPYHLKTLPPDALDVLRYLGTVDDLMAYKDDICEAVDLTDRGFGKVIRRLVTKNYVVMDGSQVYRLTELGQQSVEELAAYDAENPDDEDTGEAITEMIQRRALLVVPSLLVAGEAAQVYVGIYDLPGFDAAAEVAVRLSSVYAQPETPQEASFDLDAGPFYETFTITPDYYKRVRLKVEIYQLGPNPGDIAVAGGMYVDVDVAASADHGSAPLLAYGTDITIEQFE
ncbi:MAG: hypothetical protein K8L99_22640 [Anaerolineae bacterium]|nr:hypothetical protein [Anaerolineae bacterium]